MNETPTDKISGNIMCFGSKWDLFGKQMQKSHKKSFFFSDTLIVTLRTALFICLVFFISSCRCIVHQDNSAPLLTQEHHVFHMLRLKHGCHSFSYAAPSVWDSLPHKISHIQSTTLSTAFKTALKWRPTCSKVIKHTTAPPLPPPHDP